MYDELIKSIHCCFGFEEPAVTDCENCMMKDKREEHNYVGCCDALGLAAAEAIEELLPFKKQVEKGMGLLDKADELLKAVKPRWIPVTERLPEKFENVLVANKRGKHYDIDKGWWNGSFFDRCAKGSYSNVTHWMPLPEPPMEE